MIEGVFAIDVRPGDRDVRSTVEEVLIHQHDAGILAAQRIQPNGTSETIAFREAGRFRCATIVEAKAELEFLDQRPVRVELAFMGERERITRIAEALVPHFWNAAIAPFQSKSQKTRCWPSPA